MKTLSPTHFPIEASIEEVKSKLSKEATLIVNAPPGAGKSTILPLRLLREPWLQGKKIILLEPRRLAAKTIAQRMSQLINEPVGQTIGYRIRFETKVSENTVIEVITEGILTRMLQTDNALENVGLVIFDEFHERSIHADLSLALCRESQQVLRPDLKILIMSATLNTPELTNLLDCESVLSDGKMYPVDIQYGSDADPYMLPELIANKVRLALQTHKEGDILVFLPGKGEILRCLEMLKNSRQSELLILPLYGQLPQKEQVRAILPDKNGKRKVVLATSIAETSLTIEGVTIVIDSGFGRFMRFDPNSGLSKLTTQTISKDEADQRAGRAGRLSKGYCYRLWSSATQNRLESHRNPEIKEVDLAPLALDLAQWGINNPEKLTWLTPPPKGNFIQAKALLEDLEALEEGKITEHGRQIQKLPCHPRIAHMLLFAQEEENLDLACDLAAIVEDKDPLKPGSGVDINIRIEGLRRFRTNNGKSGAYNRIEKVSKAYRALFSIEESNGPVDPFQTGLLLAFAFPERIAFARPGNNAQFQMANGRLAQIGHKDDLAYDPWLAVAHVDAREGMGKIFLASPIDPKDLAPMVKESENTTWDEDYGAITKTELRIGNIVLKSSPAQEEDKEERVQCILQQLKKSKLKELNFDKKVVAFQNRMCSLQQWRPELNIPNLNTEQLVSDLDQWLVPYLDNCKTPEDLHKIDILEVLKSLIPYAQMQQLDQLVPENIRVPSGSTIRLEYNIEGNPPILAARLQELFGQTETPLINDGKTAVLIHLLSPGFKPVQITSDLKSFWNSAYFEVKKDLKGRYPKHYWPENPLEAEAVKGVKRRK